MGTAPALLGIAVLLLNDHLWKAAHPGALTGKLSDVAGLAFFPLLLVSLVELGQSVAGRYRGPSRRALVFAVATTGVVFAAIQLHEGAGRAYQLSLGALQWPARAAAALLEGAALPGVQLVAHTMDPWDLLALPALALPLLVGLRRAAVQGAKAPGLELDSAAPEWPCPRGDS